MHIPLSVTLQFGVPVLHNWYFCLQRCPAVHYQLWMLSQELRAIKFMFNIKYLPTLLSLLSCITVWNAMWTLVLQRYIKRQCQWFVLRSYSYLYAIYYATVPHLHITDWNAALIIYFSSRACNSTMHIRTHSPIQCFCNIKLEYLYFDTYCL